jgi:hypothetical protein
MAAPIYNRQSRIYAGLAGPSEAASCRLLVVGWSTRVDGRNLPRCPEASRNGVPVPGSPFFMAEPQNGGVGRPTDSGSRLTATPEVRARHWQLDTGTWSLAAFGRVNPESRICNLECGTGRVRNASRPQPEPQPQPGPRVLLTATCQPNNSRRSRAQSAF